MRSEVEKNLSPKELARREKRRRLTRLTLLGIAVPTFGAFVYYAVIAPPQYTSEAQFTIQTVQRRQSTADILGGIGLPSISGASNDGRIVVEYIRSPAMVRALKKSAGFDEAYSRFSLAPGQQISPKAPIEKATAFWRKKFRAKYDPNTSAVTVAVDASRPEDALRLTRGVMAASSMVVNSLNNDAQNVQRETARKELELKEADYAAARQRVVSIRGQHAIGALEAQVRQSAAMVGEIDAKMAELRVQLAVASSTFQPSSPQVRALNEQISALQAERGQALAKSLAGPGVSAAATDIAGQAALMEYEAAQKTYFMALENLRQVNLQQDSDRRFIVAFVPPQKPESSNYWKRFANVLAVAIGAAILLGTATLTYSVVRDHVQ